MSKPSLIGMHQMYGVDSGQDFERVANAHINVVFDYGTQNIAWLDKAQAAGLWALYNLKEIIHMQLIGYNDTEQWNRWNSFIKAEVTSAVNTVKNHPALYGYYPYDEDNQGSRDVAYDLQQAIYNHIKSLDPDGYIGHNIVASGGDGYDPVNWDAMDFLMPDLYCFYPGGPGLPELTFGCNQLRTHLDSISFTKPIVFIIQASDQGNEDWHDSLDDQIAIVENKSLSTGGFGMYDWNEAGGGGVSERTFLEIRDESWGVSTWPAPPDPEPETKYKSLSSSLTFSKSLTIDVFTRSIKKLIQGSLILTGSLSKNFTYALSGGLSFIGAFPGKTYEFLQSLTWTQLQDYTYKSFDYKRLFLKAKIPFSSVLSFSGSVSTYAYDLIRQVCSGVLTSSGALSQKVKCSLDSCLTFTAIKTYSFLQSLTWSELQNYTYSSLSPKRIFLKIKNKLFGSISLTGLLSSFSSAFILALKTYEELQSLVYTQLHNYVYGFIYKVAVGGLISFSSTLKQKVSSLLSGAFSPSGSLFIKAKNTLSGALNSSGALVNGVKTILSGSLSYSGIVKRHIKNSLVGSLTPTGRLIKSGFESFTDLLRKLIQLIQIED